MKAIKVAIATALIVVIAGAGYYAKRKYYDPAHRLSTATAEVDSLIAGNNLQDGDIIFQTSLSGQSKAVHLATHSTLSHCGIIFKTGDHYSVLEGVEPVSYAPLDRWIAHGKEGNYTIKRLKNASEVLTPAVIQRMKKEGRRFEGKSYDIYFGWGNDLIYCSELVWKIYQRSTGLTVGRLQLLKDFDLSNEVVKRQLKARYGDAIPLSDTVISPVSIYNSELLMTVK